MSLLFTFILILFWSAILSIPCLLAYNAAVAKEPTLAAFFLFVVIVLGATVAGGMDAVFGWEGTKSTTKSINNSQGVEAMKNIIVKRKLDGEIAVITHWDHFHVNRFTGSVIHRAFTVKVLSGSREGNSYVWSLDSLHSMFEVVGQAGEEASVAS